MQLHLLTFNHYAGVCPVLLHVPYFCCSFIKIIMHGELQRSCTVQEQKNGRCLV
jgi:hypothetical protein